MTDYQVTDIDIEAWKLIALFFFVLVPPVVLLVILKFIPAMRRRPLLSNGIAGVLAVLLSFVPIKTPILEKGILATLMAAIFYWQYRNDVRDLAKKMNPPATGSGK